jgi:hypothetical protein
MAKKTAPAVTDNADLLESDLLEDTQERGTQENGAEEDTELFEYEGKQLTLKQIEEVIKQKQAELKNLKAVAKGETPKAARVVKGVMVAFKNKKGETITGPGVVYYVARHDGKLHYKEGSQVVFLPEGWKDGDPIDWSPIEKAPAPAAEAETPQA